MNDLAIHLLPIPFAFVVVQTARLIAQNIRITSKQSVTDTERPAGSAFGVSGWFSHVFVGVASCLLVIGEWLCSTEYSETLSNIGLALYEFVLPVTFAGITYKLMRMFTRRRLGGLPLFCIAADVVVAVAFAPFCFMNLFVKAGYAAGGFAVFTHTDLFLYPVYFGFNVLAAVITVVSAVYAMTREISWRNIIWGGGSVLLTALYVLIALLRFSHPELRMILAYASPFYILLATWYEEWYLGGLLCDDNEIKVTFMNPKCPHFFLAQDGTVCGASDGISDFFGVPGKNLNGLKIGDLFVLTEITCGAFNFAKRIKRSDFSKVHTRGVYDREGGNTTIYASLRSADDITGVLTKAENASYSAYTESFNTDFGNNEESTLLMREDGDAADTADTADAANVSGTAKHGIFEQLRDEPAPTSARNTYVAAASDMTVYKAVTGREKAGIDTLPDDDDETLRVVIADVSAKYDLMGNFICAVVFVYDITDYENQRRIAEESREELEEANHKRAMFLANAVFELRSPLNTVHGLTELMTMLSGMPPVAQDYLSRLSGANGLLISTMNDIIEYSSIECGTLSLVENEYSFATLMHNIFSAAREKIADKAIIFIADISPDIPRVLKGDDARVKHTLQNLVMNACNSTVQGFIRVQAEVTIEKSRTAVLRFTVSDSGAGIGVKNAEDVFNSFDISAANVSGDEAGDSGVTKFSLALAYKLCRIMGGDIVAENSHGIGSAFTMTVPQLYDMNSATLAVVHDIRKKRVLLCESRAMYLDSLENSLKRLGVKYDVVKSTEKINHICRKYVEDRNKAIIDGKNKGDKDEAGWQYTHILMASFFYADVRNGEEFLSVPQTATYVLTECSDNVYYGSGVKTIPMPANVISITAALNEENASAYAAAAQPVAKFVAPQARALVVDDVETNLLVMRGMLAQYELTTDICTNGRRALTMLELYDYDIVFMDHIMPEMDGVETTKRIRSLATAKHDADFYTKLPIIAITANVGEGVRDKLLEAGMNDYLKKPIIVSELNECLLNFLPKEKKRSLSSEKFAAFEIAVNSFYIEGLNTTSGISHTGGTTEAYRRILRVFCDEGVEKAERLVYAYQTEDYDTLSYIYGSFVNVSKQIGAFDLSASATELASICKAKEATALRVKYDLFLTGLLTLVKNIRESLNNFDTRDTMAAQSAQSGSSGGGGSGGKLPGGTTVSEAIAEKGVDAAFAELLSSDGRSESEHKRRQFRLAEFKEALSGFSECLDVLNVRGCDAFIEQMLTFTDLPEYIGNVAMLNKSLLTSDFDEAAGIAEMMTDALNAEIE